jgi:hypothetical protein
MNTEPTKLSLSKDYSFTLSGERLHNTLVALIDAERIYRKHGYIGMADNAIEIHQLLVSQIDSSLTTSLPPKPHPLQP